MALFNSKKKKLFSAVLEGDLKQVKELLETTSFFQPRIDIDAPEEDEGYTLLHVAVENNHLEIVRYLVEQGANVNKSTPLITACEQGDLDTAQYLIEKGADVNQGRYTTIEGFYTALHKAAQNGDLNIVKCLVKHGADIHALTIPSEDAIYFTEYETPLKIAQKNNQNEVAEFLTQCLQNPQKYPSIKQQNLKTQLDELSVDKLATLPQSDPELLQKIIITGQLASVFERLPYEKQMNLYKSTREKMKPEEKKNIEKVIRTARQNKGK